MRLKNKKKFKIAIIGGGIIGSSISFKLSQNDIFDLTLFEKKEIGNGSTKKSGGFIRCFNNDDLIDEYSIASMNFFNEYKKEIEFVENGCFYPFKRSEKDEYLEKYNSFTSKFPDYPLQFVDKNFLVDNFKLVDDSEIHGAIFEPKAGYVNPLKMTNYLIDRSINNKVHILTNTEVHWIIKNKNDYYDIHTSDDIFENFDKVIICSGAWSNDLLKQLNEPTQIVVNSIQINHFPKVSPYKTPNMVYDKLGLYLREVSSDDVFVGCTTYEIIKDPKMLNHELEPKNKFLKRTQKKLEDLKIKNILIDNPQKSIRSYDAYTHNKRPLIYESKINKGLFVITGFNGGGVKISPKVAQIIYEYLMKGIAG